MENIKTKVSPKDFFLYVGAMAALYVSAFSLLALLFNYINILFPDQLDFYRESFSSVIRFSIASLIIIFPTYLALTKVLNRDVKNNPEKKELWIRKWLIYFTLFVAGITIIIQLIRLINEFLGGDITTQFALKIAAVLVVTGAVFGYYMYDLKGKWEREVKKAKTIGWITALVVLAAVISGFFIIGTPSEQRFARFDREKVNDLQNIQRQIVNFWQNKERLPENLTELEDPISGFVVPVDPQTGGRYSYRALGELTFELCAVFNKASAGLSDINTRVTKPVPVGREFGIENNLSSDGWRHGEGEECFERTIDPDLYPVRD